MADELRKEPGLDVQLTDGNKGEFTVEVDGRTVSQKGENLPPVEQVVDAVHRALPAGSSHG